MRGLPGRISVTWFALVAATLGLACLSEHSARGRVVVPLLTFIAAFKVRLVFLHFMELSITRPPWRYIFEGWILVCALLIAGLYLYAPG
jgi:hypothetical protein